VLLTVVGAVDLVTSVQVNRALDGVLQRSPPPPRVTADLAGVSFMDTSGIAVLLGARRRAHEAGCGLVVSSMSPYLTRLFEMTEIDRVLTDEGVRPPRRRSRWLENQESVAGRGDRSERRWTN
jgi:anti-anti-sigma factor